MQRENQEIVYSSRKMVDCLTPNCSSSTSSARGLANNAGRELTFAATSRHRQLTLTATELILCATSSQTTVSSAC
jgi:hypothetical protein